MQYTQTAIDRAAMAFSAACILLGVVVLGVVELLAGQPYGAAPLTNDAGEVVAMPLVDPTLRTGLVVLGLLVVLGWGLYKLWVPETVDEKAHVAETTAD